MKNPELPAFAKATPAGLELRLKVVPGASRSALAGILGDRLKIRVAAPPEDGKANRAVIALLEKWLDGTTVTLIAGLTFAEKTVRVVGRTSLSEEELSRISPS